MRRSGRMKLPTFTAQRLSTGFSAISRVTPRSLVASQHGSTSTRITSPAGVRTTGSSSVASGGSEKSKIR